MARAMILNAELAKKSRPPGDRLTQRQQDFVREYLVDLNAKQAAIRAGYSKATAGEMGHENLNKPQIKKLIDAALERRQRRVVWKAEDILADLQAIAQDPAVRPRDRLKAYELAGKHLGMYRDVVEHSGSLAHLDFSGITTEELRRLAAIDQADQDDDETGVQQ